LGEVFDAGGNVWGTFGALYAQTYLWSPAIQEAWMGVAANCPAKMWVNGELVVQSFRYPLLRPNYGGNRESYATVRLCQGWNEVLLKFVRSAESAPFACHLMISDAGKLHDGLPTLGRTRMPWDVR
jgi:hypothetical protein